MRKTIVVTALVLAAVTGGAGPAGAAPSPTPNGYTGACNMMRDPQMMTTVMQRISAQGMAGMMGAHAGSGCDAG